MRPIYLVFFVCLAEVVGMLPFATFPGLLPDFLTLWQLSGSEAGWLSGVFFLGYMVAVPVLSALTDRMDARWVYFVSLILTIFTSLGFALWAYDFWSGMPWRFLAGVGLAGSYMPGLKALNDRIPEAMRARAIAFYTSSFGVGASGSYYLAGVVNDALGWQWAFAIAGVGPLLALFIGWAVLRPQPVRAPAPLRELLNFGPVLRNRNVMGYVMAYCAHNFELFGMRAWSVAFLVFAATQQPEGSIGFPAATALLAIYNLLAMPASVLGNEMAQRWGRKRVITVTMILGGGISASVGFLTAMPFLGLVLLMAVYAWLIAGDSSAITAGAILNADPNRIGATMAVHSTLGFAFAFAGSFIPGLALDWSGGVDSSSAWGTAYFSLAVGVFLGPLALLWLTTKHDKG